MLQQLCPPERLNDLQDYNRQADYGFITTEEYIRSVAEVTGKSEQEIIDIIRIKHVRNDELVAYVAGLRERYKVAMLSNISNDVIERLFTAEELERLFDEVVLSYHEHIIKPNPAVFVLTAERLGLSPGECVMIDDRMENCDGAEAVGMESILHTSNAVTIELLSKKLQSQT